MGIVMLGLSSIINYSPENNFFFFLGVSITGFTTGLSKTKELSQINNSPVMGSSHPRDVATAFEHQNGAVCLDINFSFIIYLY
jgi:hypothetical protein